MSLFRRQKRLWIVLLAVSSLAALGSFWWKEKYPQERIIVLDHSELDFFCDPEGRCLSGETPSSNTPQTIIEEPSQLQIWTFYISCSSLLVAAMGTGINVFVSLRRDRREQREHDWRAEDRTRSKEVPPIKPDE
jgi:hypothetical protein